MLNIKQVIVVAVMMASATTAFSQEFDIDKYDLPGKVKFIESSGNKIPYLRTFLTETSDKPQQYYAASRLTRDSVIMQMQMDYQVLLLSVFVRKKKEAGFQQVQKWTSEVHEGAIQLINEGINSQIRQEKIDTMVSKINLYLDKNNLK